MNVDNNNIGFEAYSSSFVDSHWGRTKSGLDQKEPTRTRSHGINARKFHDDGSRKGDSNKEVTKKNNDTDNRKRKRSMTQMKKSLLQAKLRVDHDDIKRKFHAMTNVSVCKLWPLQEPALKHLDELNEEFHSKNEGNIIYDGIYSSLWSMEPRIFAIEKSATGKRKYLVCHLGRFMHHYWRFCPQSARHFYELIREGTPCRLYFDLEYNKKANPDITDTDNETLLDEFIAELTDELQKVYNIAIDRTNIVDLDSSTEKKFSRHFIIHMPNGELFADAPSCGIFVKNFIGRLAEEVATGEMAKKCPTLGKYLFVQNKPLDQSNESTSNSDENNNQIKGRNMTCFIDSGVYTRNRLFRILGSSKYGKPPSAALRIASTNQFPFPNGFGNEKFYVPDFVDINRNNIEPLEPKFDNNDDEELFYGFDYEKEDDYRKLHNWEKHAEALDCTLVIPTRNPKINEPQNILPSPLTEEERNSVDDQFKQMIRSVTHQGQDKQLLTAAPKTTRKHRMITRSNHIGPTMFPSLDEFVLNTLGQRKHMVGSIRAWTIETMKSDENDTSSKNLRNSLITYHMKDNRWCENINRCHKSNNIMWNIRINDGTYYQSCHDPDCRMSGFRGTVEKLPKDVCVRINNVLLEKEIEVDDDFTDALLNLDC